MSEIAVYTLTSPLHDEEVVNRVSSEFIENIEERLGEKLLFRGADFTDYGTHDLDLIYVRTGGTEGLFRQVAGQVMGTGRPLLLLTSGKSNSLAASMEILSYLRQNDGNGEILHGSAAYIAERITLLRKIAAARKKLGSTRLGVIGAPSDWLISSNADYQKVRSSLGVELVDIPMQELLDEIAKKEYPEDVRKRLKPCDMPAFECALQIYGALRRIVDRYRLGGLTLRCFDLLGAVGNTGCLALAILNSEGIMAGCEGDVPALLSMTIAEALTGNPGFQSNPSRIDPQTGELLFAHCTIPLNMVKSYDYDTHFESGLGVAIAGEVPGGDVTIFKLSGDVTRAFVAEGILVRNQRQKDLCRTQVVLHLDKGADYFLTGPIGNHHIIVRGHHGAVLKAFLKQISVDL